MEQLGGCREGTLRRQSDQTSRRSLTVYRLQSKEQLKQNKGLDKPALVLLSSRLLTSVSFGTTLSLDLGDKSQIATECLVLAQEQCRSCQREATTLRMAYRDSSHPPNLLGGQHQPTCQAPGSTVAP